jgi:hypothetical protein
MQTYDTISGVELVDFFPYSRFLGMSPDNYLIYTTYQGGKEDYKPIVHVLNYRRTQVAIIKASKDTTVTLNALPNGSELLKETKQFTIQVVADDTKLANVGTLEEETGYLSESLSSEYLYVRSIP